MHFAIGETDFLLDGEPFRILSGALHYFRVHPGQWADRIRKARQLGLNTIETYVAWNAHAQAEGEFRLDGGLDLGRFLDLVAAEGMFAIVRPGPYICAEWTNGGLPAWVSAPGAVIRRNDPHYMAAVHRYLAQLAPVLVPRQIDQGGPVILVQVENEYGAYGSDHDYLRALAKALRGIGITVPLTTVDQPTGSMLADGGLPELHATASFGSQAAERLAALRRHQPTGPLMCAEFWNGWFDDWGGHHHVTSAAASAAELDEMLRLGASVNMYMFHGGTNFGLANGANDKGTYRPITTSYDYDAPLDEAGNPTAKYWAFREVLARYTDVPADRPAPAPPAPAFGVSLSPAVPLWTVADRVGGWTSCDDPVSADELGQAQGFTLYQAGVDAPGPAVLEVGEVRDRAQVFLNRQPVGVLARERRDRGLSLPSGARGMLELLVEDQGRVDYGPRIGEPKGLFGPVTVGGVPIRGWRMLPLPLDDVTPAAEALRAQPAAPAGPVAGPAFTRAVFDLAEAADLFLSTEGLGKGVAWLNGFCVGRYWSRGPQRTLYVPGPVVRTEGNELIILELGATTSATVRFVPGPDLGHTEP
ncbi:MAG TPA: beta-galactosidase family protein [Trebonia sp.]|nr:beta-galactosidase family protein [Trebonia sp.]